VCERERKKDFNSEEVYARGAVKQRTGQSKLPYAYYSYEESSGGNFFASLPLPCLDLATNEVIKGPDLPRII
jgi:hypothetical protein